jgi:predicted ATP-dependent serine protease
MACGFASQGKRGIYFFNEDSDDDFRLRVVCCLSQMDKFAVHRDPDKAYELAMNSGYGNMTLVAMSPGNMTQIERCVRKYQPRWIVVDQIRNIFVKSDNRVNQLEKVATEVRNIAKRYQLTAVSVTQAGDSATDKAVLDMGDVDFSNTGIPAQADLMIGLGSTPDMRERGEQMVSLPKNKVSGKHDHFPVLPVRQLSYVKSVA